LKQNTPGDEVKTCNIILFLQTLSLASAS